MNRLIQAGLELQFYPAQFAELAAESVSCEAAWFSTVTVTCMVQAVLEHPVGCQRGSWGTISLAAAAICCPKHTWIIAGSALSMYTSNSRQQQVKFMVLRELGKDATLQTLILAHLVTLVPEHVPQRWEAY